jgi:hypothetical protein
MGCPVQKEKSAKKAYLDFPDKPDYPERKVHPDSPGLKVT